MKGLRSTNWKLQNSPGDVKHSIGNIVNTVITTYGARWVLEIQGGTLYKVHDCLTPPYAVHLKVIQNNIEYKR